MKKDAELYDVNNPTKVLGNITQGTTVIVPKAREYTPKPVVEYSVGRKTFKGRVKFDLLQKPGIKPRGDPSNVRTIGNKTLTPDGLGLGGKTIRKNEYIKHAKEAVDKNKLVSPHVKDFLKTFLEKSSSKQASWQKIEGISSKDLAVIAKDFGEIAGAWWFINNYANDLHAIEFPSAANEPLIDYYAIKKTGLKVGVSAKAGGGAAPSLASVWGMVEDMKLTQPHQRDVRDFIGAVVNNSGTEGIVQAAKSVDSKIGRAHV